MNDLARETLIQAGLTNVPQAFGYFRDGKAKCALGVLGFGEFMFNPQFRDLCERYDLDVEQEIKCLECSVSCNEFSLLMHYNDSHHFDFLTIARKM